MTVSLVIDNRERELKEYFKDRPNVQTCNMDIGDVMFKNSEDETLLVIERKSVSDLAASICDGRHREQKARLLGSGLDKDRIMYLIEGKLDKDPKSKIGSVTIETLHSSIINTELRDGIRVHKTSSIRETQYYIEKLHEKLQKESDKFWKPQSDMTESQYCSTLKTRKKDNMTPNVWYISSLSMIPQVTTKIATAISELYPNMHNLLEAIAKQYDENKNSYNLLLKDITYETTTGKTRRIGPKVSSRICSYLYPSISSVYGTKIMSTNEYMRREIVFET